MTSSRCFDDLITLAKALCYLTQFIQSHNQLTYEQILSPNYFFQTTEKHNDDVTFFCLDLGFVLCGSRYQSQSRDQSRSWSQKNFAISILVSDESALTTALHNSI